MKKSEIPKKLEDFKNIGPKTADLLRRAHITPEKFLQMTPEDLYLAMFGACGGPVMFKKMPAAILCPVFYAAQRNVNWVDVPLEIKAKYKDFAKDLKESL